MTRRKEGPQGAAIAQGAFRPDSSDPTRCFVCKHPRAMHVAHDGGLCSHWWCGRGDDVGSCKVPPADPPLRLGVE